MNKENLKQWCITNLLNSKGKINGNKLRTDYKFYHENIDKFNLINELTDFPTLTLGFKVICIINDVWSNPVCPECGNPTTYRGYDGVLFSPFCSHECGQKSEITRNKRSNSVKKAYIERGNEIVKASKKTKLERYGNENYTNQEKGLETWHSKSSEEKELVVIKRRKTRLKKYGLEGYNNREKATETMLERYGVEHYSKTDNYKETMYEYNINRTIDEKLEIIEKKKETCLLRYGVDSYSKTDKFKDLVNDLNNSRTEEEWNYINNKIKETQIKKYGALYVHSKNYRELKESIGEWTPLEQKSDKELYYYYVNKITENNYKQYKELIDPNSLRSRYDLNENAYHLDHMFSKINGFKNCILPWVIGHPCNLEMIYSLDNARKGKDCSHTIDELYYKIDNFTN